LVLQWWKDCFKALAEAGSASGALLLVGAVLCSFIQLQQVPLNKKIDMIDSSLNKKIDMLDSKVVGMLDKLDLKLERLSHDSLLGMQKLEKMCEQHSTTLTQLRVSVAELNVKVKK
jgi:hypothetical protein